MLSKYPIQKSIRQANCRWNKSIRMQSNWLESGGGKKRPASYRDDEESNNSNIVWMLKERTVLGKAKVCDWLYRFLIRISRAHNDAAARQSTRVYQQNTILGNDIRILSFLIVKYSSSPNLNRMTFQHVDVYFQYKKPICYRRRRKEAIYRRWTLCHFVTATTRSWFVNKITTRQTMIDGGKKIPTVLWWETIPKLKFEWKMIESY